MPEMTPDPVLAKLARFTPNAVDPAELLFAAGRASARTPWYWKASVAGSLLVNVACVGVMLTRPEVTHVVPVEPPVAPAIPVVPEPAPVTPLGSTPNPWSLQALHHLGDPDRLPQSEPRFEISHSGTPLTVFSARSGELD